MSPATTTRLSLEGSGGVWKLRIGGDWSLASMPAIEAQLKGLPNTLQGSLQCNWLDAAAPSLATAWMLLTRLNTMGVGHLDVEHVGNSPHFVELLQKLRSDWHAAKNSPHTHPSITGLVGTLGLWSVVQGRHAHGVVAFFGRIVSVLGQAFKRPRALRASSLTRHIYENRHHRDSHRLADRVSDQRHRGLSRCAAAVDVRRGYFRG